MKQFKNKTDSEKIIICIISLLIFLVSANISLAESFSEIQTSSSLEAGKTLEGTGFFSDEKINIDGTVDGTVFASGSEINVHGTINGDLFVAGQNININGKVNGSVFAAGQYVSIDGEIQNNIYSAGSVLGLHSKNMGDAFLAGQSITIGEKASVKRDLFAGASRVFDDGQIGRNFYASADEILLNGDIGKNAKISSRDLKVTDSAKINGNLYYRSEDEADIANPSSIAGNTDWTKTEPEPEKAIISFAVLSRIFFSMISTLLIWLIVKLFKPELWPDLASNIALSPLRTSGIGALTLLVTPIIAIILMISIIGIPLGIILGFLYGISIYLSTIISAVFIGGWLSGRFNWTEVHKGIWLFLLGLIIIYLLEMIPVAGLFVRFIVVAAGIGSLIIGVSKLRENKKDIYTQTEI